MGENERKVKERKEDIEIWRKKHIEGGRKVEDRRGEGENEEMMIKRDYLKNDRNAYSVGYETM